MPHLVQMDKRNRSKGLVIIGAEVQNSADAAIKGVTDKHKVKFTVTKGVSGPSTGRSIPRAVVFDATGQVVYSGHPGDDKFERSVKKALSALKKSGGAPGAEVAKGRLPAKKEPLVAQRAWTNLEGKTIKASVLALEGGNVKFKFSNGKTVDYPLEKLSEDDQEAIKEAAVKVKETAKG